MSPIVLGIVLIVLGLLLPLPIVLFVINRILLKPSYKTETASNLGLREDLTNPFEGLTRCALVPLAGTDRDIPDSKSRKQLQFTVEKGHQSIKMNIVLYCQNKKGEEVAFDGVAYTNSSPYEIGDTYAINLPVKTVAVGISVVELDGVQKPDDAYQVEAPKTGKLLLASILFALFLAITVAFVHMGMQCIWNSSATTINPVYFILPFVFGYAPSLSTLLFFGAFALTLVLSTLITFFALKNKKGARKGANHG